MFGAYKYLYYRIYAWQLWAWGGEHQPHFNAMLGVTVLVYFNVLSLFFASEAFTEFGLLNGIGNIHALTGGAIIGIINYFIFLYQGRYKQIAKLLETESELDKKKRLIWCWLYVIFTFVGFFVSLLLLPVNK